MLGGVYQAKAAVFIIAQTIPVIRVLLQSDTLPKSSTISGQTKPKQVAVNTRTPNIELVQLPGGRIVAADSDDGRALQSRQHSQPEQVIQPRRTGDLIDAGVGREAPVDDALLEAYFGGQWHT